MQAYIEGWRLGLKALAVYRDGSKRTQPLNAGQATRSEGRAALEAARPVRHKLPDERTAITHKFSIAGHEGYLTVGLYDDGQPGEIFLRMAKEGSTVSGLMDTIATMTSIALQYGVPLKALVDKFSHTRFEPVGLHQQPRDPDREVGRSTTCSATSATASCRRAGGRRRAGERTPRRRGSRPLARRGRRRLGCARADRALRHREPGRRAELQRLRLDHGSQRRLLQVPELRRHERLQLSGCSAASSTLDWGVRGVAERGVGVGDGNAAVRAPRFSRGARRPDGSLAGGSAQSSIAAERSVAALAWLCRLRQRAALPPAARAAGSRR